MLQVLRVFYSYYCPTPCCLSTLYESALGKARRQLSNLRSCKLKAKEMSFVDSSWGGSNVHRCKKPLSTKHCNMTYGLFSAIATIGSNPGAKILAPNCTIFLSHDFPHMVAPSPSTCRGIQASKYKNRSKCLKTWGPKVI